MLIALLPFYHLTAGGARHPSPHQPAGLSNMTLPPPVVFEISQPACPATVLLPAHSHAPTRLICRARTQIDKGEQACDGQALQDETTAARPAIIASPECHQHQGQYKRDRHLQGCPGTS